MTESLLTTGRYHILSGGLPHPAQCAMCSEANRPVVTFSFQIPRYGTFMMCTECFKSCVRDLSPVLGFTPTEDYRALSELYTIVKEENERFHRGFDGLAESIRGVVDEHLSVSIAALSAADYSDSEQIQSVEVQSGIDERQFDDDAFFLFEPDGKPAENLFGLPDKPAKTD